MFHKYIKPYFPHSSVLVQVLGGDKGPLHPLPEHKEHLHHDLSGLDRLRRRLPGPAPRLEGRELVGAGGRRGVYGEYGGSKGGKMENFQLRQSGCGC